MFLRACLTSQFFFFQTTITCVWKAKLSDLYVYFFNFKTNQSKIFRICSIHTQCHMYNRYNNAFGSLNKVTHLPPTRFAYPVTWSDPMPAGSITVRFPVNSTNACVHALTSRPAILTVYACHEVWLVSLCYPKSWMLGLRILI